GEAVSGPLDRDRGLRRDPFGLEAGLAQRERQGHRKATRVRSREQLLRVRPGLALEAGGEGIGRIAGTASHGQLPSALLDRPLPDRLRSPCRHGTSPDAPSTGLWDRMARLDKTSIVYTCFMQAAPQSALEETGMTSREVRR